MGLLKEIRHYKQSHPNASLFYKLSKEYKRHKKESLNPGNKEITSPFNLTPEEEKVVKKHDRLVFISLGCIIVALLAGLVTGVVIAANKNARDNESLIPEFTADNSGVKAFDVDRTFTYKDDMLSVYVCNKMTNDFIKIDYYSRSLPTDDSLKFIKNIGTFDIRNKENGFNWIDVDHLAFTFNLELPSVKGKSTVIFKTSLNGDGGNMGSNVVDSVTHYSCLTNSTYKYYAVALSNDFVQIERWTIINPLKKNEFYYDYDLILININSTTTSFSWGDNKNSFVFKPIKGLNETDWKGKEFVSFTKDNVSSVNTVADYLES